MKLLVAPLGALSRYVSRESFHLVSALMHDYGWQHVELYDLHRERGPLDQKLLRRFGVLPEVVLFREGYRAFGHQFRAWVGLGAHLGVLADDLHGPKRAPRMSLMFHLCDVVFSTYAHVFPDFFPEIPMRKVRWTPHAACPDFHVDFNEQPENTVLLSGAVNDVYPMRQQLKAYHEQHPDAVHWHPHPGYHCRYEHNGSNHDVGRGFAERIRRHRAAFTDGSKYRYLVAKHFEIPATGALLLGDEVMRPVLRQLGFIENEHYVPTSSQTLDDTIRYVRDERDHATLDLIRKRGQSLVETRHTTNHRAAFIDAVLADRSRPAPEGSLR